MSSKGGSYLVNYITDKDEGEGIAIRKDGGQIQISCNSGYNCRNQAWPLGNAPITKDAANSGDQYNQILAEPLDSENKTTKDSCEDIYLKPESTPGSYIQSCRD